MNEHQLIFLKLLETELNRVIVPAAGNDMSRRIAALSAQQIKRILIDETIVPPLRTKAIAEYRELMPALRPLIGEPLCEKLGHALDGALQDWRSLDVALTEVTSTLTLGNGPAARHLIGRLVEIDARIRTGKEAAWVEQSKAPPPGADQASEPGGLDGEQQARLLLFLQQRFPNETELKIVAVKPLVGGFSKQTLFVELEGASGLPNGLANQLVMRRDAQYVTAGSSVTMEFPIIEKMYAAGVKVPRPYVLDETGSVLGTPFILVERVSGRILGNFPVVAEPSREVALNLARQLARLHAVPVDGLEHLLYGGDLSVRDRVLAEIEMHEAMWKTVENHRAFTVQTAIDWLKRNIDLADGSRSVVHRDIGVHNFLVRNNDIAAFLDWETAVVGTPGEDVGYTYYQVTQMIDWDEYLAAYERAAGIKLNKRRLDFYMLWGSVRVVVGMCKMVDPVFGGDRVNLPEYYLGDYFGQTLMQRVATKLADILAHKG